MKIYRFVVKDVTAEPTRFFLVHKNSKKSVLSILKFEYTEIPLTETEGTYLAENGLTRTLKFSQFDQDYFEKCISGENNFSSFHLANIFDLNFIEDFKNSENYYKFCGCREIRLDKSRIYPVSLFTNCSNNYSEQFSTIEDSFAKTYNSKLPYYWFNDRGNNQISVFFPSSSSNFDDDSNTIISYFSPRNFKTVLYGFGDSVEIIDIIEPEEDSSDTLMNKREVRLFYFEKLKEIIESHMPKLVLSKPTKCGQEGVDLEVTCEYNGKPLSEEIYVVTDSGYVSRQKIQLDKNGWGTFRFIPLGLAFGDKAEIKVGFRLFTGVDKTEILVV